MNQHNTLVVGIGSSHGDDQAGWLVVDSLSKAHAQFYINVRKAQSPADVLHWLEDIDRLIICDACRGLDRVGTVRRFPWPAIELQTATFSGTHDLSLTAALTLAEHLGRLPGEVEIWAVEGAAGEMESPISPEVSAALPQIVNQIMRRLHDEPLPARQVCMSNH